jgi:glutamine synthetase
VDDQTFCSVEDVISFIKKQSIRMIDLKLVDMVGRMHHLTLPASGVSADLFQHGFGFDGSSYAGFKSVEAGDLCMIPDYTSAVLDPFWEVPTLSFFCYIVEADSKKPFARDPRTICMRAEQHLLSLDLGEYLLAPEYEFYVFDDVRYKINNHGSFYELDVHGEDDCCSSYQLAKDGGYHAVPPLDRFHDLRSAICEMLEGSGVRVKYHHHEVGGSGQNEIELGFETLGLAADQNIWIKYVIRNLAQKSGKYATFMPKPLFGEAGSGLHVHQYLYKNGKSQFYTSKKDAYGNLSDSGRWFVGGLLEHGRALSAFTNPSLNSYCRLVPGFEAPVSLFYSLANRTSAVRIPKYARNPIEMRIEYRSPDATANPYLAFSAMLLAGLDGIKRKVEPPAPIDSDITTLSKRDLAKIAVLPASLGEALQSLERDHKFLLEGGVFTEDLILSYTELKRRSEIDEAARRPSPMDYSLYFDL